MSAFHPFRTCASVRFRPIADITPRCQIDPVTTIYMPLLNEGTPCARPVEATRERDDQYRVEGPVPADEEWEFGPGTMVVCEWTTFDDGQEGLLALRLAE